MYSKILFEKNHMCVLMRDACFALIFKILNIFLLVFNDTYIFIAK